MQRSLLASATLFVCASVASANHIDFFQDGAFLSATTNELGAVSSTQTGNPGNIFGSEREVLLSATSGAGLVSTATVGAVVGAAPGSGAPGNGRLLVDTGTGVLGRVVLTYDGTGSTGFNGGAGADFDTIYNFLAINLTDIQGTGDFSIKVTDAADNMGTVTQSVNSPGLVAYSFDDAGFAGVDFFTVKSVVVTLQSTQAASDFQIREITREVVVPEPAALGLISLGGLVLLRRRRA